MSRRNFLKALAATAVTGFGSSTRSSNFLNREQAANLPDEEFWENVRDQYALTKERVYLNAGGLGPAPRPVLDEYQRLINEMQLVSETGHGKIEQTRKPVARFVGAEPDEIAFTRNATEGNSTIASGLRLRPGDEIIFESHAHPGGSIAWLSRQKYEGIVVKIFEPHSESATENVQRIKQLITPRTRVVQVSHVTAPTGIRLPVEAIANLTRQRNIWFHVDGSQSLGMFSIDLKSMGCDSYATSCHKWLGAPHGNGLMYVRKERLDEIQPTDVGAYSDAGYALPDMLKLHPSARRFESGTRCAASIVAIAKAIEFMNQIGMDKVSNRGHSLSAMLRKELAELEGVEVLSPQNQRLATAMCTFRIPHLASANVYRYLLRQHKLRCRIVRERDLNGVRVSTHIFNSLAECERVIQAVAQAQSKL